jgi:hypothetical protein
MQTEEVAWMQYIHAEVKAVCVAKGWAHQVRRKWSIREKPVSQSTILDYERQLVPNAHGELPEAGPHDFNGTYYVLSFDQQRGVFVVQHDTLHASMWGPNWELKTYTEIDAEAAAGWHKNTDVQGPASSPPPYRLRAGWLYEHLMRLVSVFGANSFSVT